MVGVRQKELFLQGHEKTQLILAVHFINMKGRRDIRVEKKKIGSDSAERTDVLAVLTAQNINRHYVNRLYLSKCIDSW